MKYCPYPFVYSSHTNGVIHENQFGFLNVTHTGDGLVTAAQDWHMAWICTVCLDLSRVFDKV